MYSSERVNWWLSRSLSEGHQQAYDTIAREIPRANTGVLVEVACGPGEMLKRVNSKGYNLVIGADASQEMLEAALKNLSGGGIESKVEPDPSRATAHIGVVLVRDNVFDSRLPKEIADVVLFTFPEVGHEYLPQDEDGYLLRRYRETTGRTVKDDEKQGMLTDLRIYQQLARVAGKKGCVIVVSYFASRRNFSQREIGRIQETEKMAEINGLESQQCLFVVNHEVFGDTEMTREKICGQLGCDRRDVKTGFMIWKYAKKY